MKIVIDIDEHIYEQIMADSKVYILDNEVDRILIENAIYNGTPLPEHHGRLIDKTELSDHIKNRLIQTAMNNMETILPYSKVCTDIVDNRIDIWIDEVKTIIEGSDTE